MYAFKNQFPFALTASWGVWGFFLRIVSSDGILMSQGPFSKSFLLPFYHVLQFMLQLGCEDPSKSSGRVGKERDDLSLRTYFISVQLQSATPR